MRSRIPRQPWTVTIVINITRFLEGWWSQIYGGSAIIVSISSTILSDLSLVGTFSIILGQTEWDSVGNRESAGSRSECGGHLLNRSEGKIRLTDNWTHSRGGRNDSETVPSVCAYRVNNKYNLLVIGSSSLRRIAAFPLLLSAILGWFYGNFRMIYPNFHTQFSPISSQTHANYQAPLSVPHSLTVCNRISPISWAKGS